MPRPHGLFVGALNDHDDVTLSTYLRPGDNDRPSRWQPYAALFAAMPGARASPARGGDVLQWMIDHIVALQASAPFVVRFPFLLEPYRGTDDPLDAMWSAARTEARDGEPAPD
ncbi:hypothetical protein BGC_40850 [Burkholderia sp. 3C]